MKGLVGMLVHELSRPNVSHFGAGLFDGKTI